MTREQLSSGSYIVMGRRYALGAVVAVVLSGVGSFVSFSISDARQTDKIVALEHAVSELRIKAEKEVTELRLKSEKDRNDIYEIKADIKVIRSLLEGRDIPRRPRE